MKISQSLKCQCKTAVQAQLTALEKLCLSGDKEHCKGADLEALAPTLCNLTRLTHLDLLNYDIQVRLSFVLCATK